jgi:hypothetical protein
MVEVVSKKVPIIGVKLRQQPCFIFISKTRWEKTLLTILPTPDVMNNV